MFRIILLVIALLLVKGVLAQKRDYMVVESEMQSARGTEKARLLIELANQDIYTDQTLARERALEALAIGTELKDRKRIGWSLRYLGLSYHFEDEIDSARHYYEKCAPYFDKPKDQGWSYFNIATIFESSGDYDSVEYYLSIAEPLFLQDTALVELGSVSNMRGNIQSYKGDWSNAASYFKKALQYFNKKGDLSRAADALVSLGNAHASLEDYETCIQYMKESLDMYDRAPDLYYKSQALNFIGYYYNVLNDKDSSRHYLESALTLSDSVNNSFVKGSSLADLAILDGDEGKWDIARLKLNQAKLEFEKTNDQYQISDVYKKLGDLELKSGQYRNSETYYKEALQIAENLGAQDSEKHIYKGLTDLYQKNSKYKDAFHSYQAYVAIEDSLQSVEKAKSLQDILVQYETEKKESQIVLLNKQTELDATRQKALWGGMALLFLMGSSVIYTLIQRRKKERLIEQQERAIEVEKRRNAEQELEFKKKELTAKALQLARKNEFLHSLESQVEELKSSVDDTVSKTSAKITRLIQMDSNDDEEWDQFGKEFSSIHQDFLDRLQAQYGAFSKGEMRLIALMKMNLSSKDIASTLRISDNGIKKARYRLRKKMALESDIDLQEYFLTF